jgi:adenine C2-methylase RlmN of 23S rRNA A2503 and tRNA A37
MRVSVEYLSLPVVNDSHQQHQQKNVIPRCTSHRPYYNWLNINSRPIHTYVGILQGNSPV